MRSIELVLELEKRLRTINDIASVPYKLTGKFSHITDLSQECLDMIAEFNKDRTAE